MQEERHYEKPDTRLRDLLESKFNESKQAYILTAEEWKQYVVLRHPDLSHLKAYYRGYPVIKENKT